MIIWQAHKARIRQMAFSPDGAELATTAGSSKFVWLWRAATGEPAGRLAGHSTYARGVAYSPDGKFLASTQNGSQARVWDRATGGLVAELNTGWCADFIAFRPDSSSVALAAATPSGVGEWPVSRFEGKKRGLAPSHRFGTEFVSRVCFSPCGRYLAAGRYRGLSLFDASTRELLREFSDPHASADAAQFAFAPDGDSLAVVYGLRIHLFALPDGRETGALRGHPNFIHALGFMPDGRALVSAGADGIVRVWDASACREARSFDWGIGKVCAAAVSPDGLLCAAGGENGKVVVWDVDG